MRTDSGRQPGALAGRRREERVGHRLVEAQAQQHLRSWRRRACTGESRPCTVDFGTVLPMLRVAVLAGDLLDDVDLDRCSRGATTAAATVERGRRCRST